MLRTLAHYRAIHLAVAAGAAIATAVLAGALLVGDSVRGSLRDLTLDRLGSIEHALVAAQPFREALADDLDAAGLTNTAPLILIRGSVTHADKGSRAASVAILGVDRRFIALYPDTTLVFTRDQKQNFPSVVLNQTLARELGAKAGDALLLHFERPSDIPRETLLGETEAEDVLGRLRATVAAVIPDRGPGRFGIVPTQGIPKNAFLELKDLQRALDLRGEANAMLSPSKKDPQPILDAKVTLEDLGLTLEERDDHVTLGSRRLVLSPRIDAALDQVARDLASPMMRTQSYLANATTLRDRLLPYSLVAALDPRSEPWGRLTLTDGTSPQTPGPNDVLLDTWAAEDLGAAPGDTVEMRYFEVGAGERLTEKTTALTVAGIVKMEDLGADPTLTPPYPGIRDARDMSAWDPPFPVDLDLIRKKDEDYWDAHGATPKMFVSAETGKKLWSTRFGSTTAVRFATSADRLRQALQKALPPETLGLSFRPVKEEGLRAASGSTDFSMLFVSFSFFIIASAALLVGLLFRLGVEQRASEIGLLLAVGHRVKQVRRRLLTEGLILAAAGGLLGLALGVGYAALMMAALRTLWRPAVGSSELYLHVGATSLPLGFAISLAVVQASIFLAVRKLVRIAPQRLLRGSIADTGKTRPSRTLSILTAATALAALGLLAYALATGQASNPALAFGSGALLLLSGLAAFTLWCRAPGRGAFARGNVGLATMAAKNTAWSPGRSVLSAALVASACFVLVLVGASAGEGEDPTSKTSGTGGYALVATSEVPLHQPIEQPDAQVTAFRVLRGDDASCLNLYRPEKPTILGVPRDFIERNAFTMKQHLDVEGENPWRLLEQPLEPGVVPAVADLNSAMWILHVGLGKDLVIENERGEPLRLRLVGLLDRSVIQSEVLISESNFLEQFPSRTGHSYFLIDTEEADKTEVAEQLESTLAPFGFDATSTRDKLASYRTVENTYLATFQMLGALGLLLGTAGLGIVLLRNVLERRGELATLRAFGFRRSRLAAMVLMENAFLLVVGIAVGSIAALVAVAPNLGSGHVPWESLSVTLAAVWGVGMLSSVLAVRGTMRTPLLGVLKAER